MRYFATAVTLALFFTNVHGAPKPLLNVLKVAGEINPHNFIVKLKNGTDKTAHIAGLQPHLEASGSQITYDYHSEFFHAFAGKFTPEALDVLRASPDVEYIEEDGIAHTMATVTQRNAPWGIARLSQTPRLSGSPNSLNFTYRFDSSAGQGVDIYVVDTGVFVGHADFGGRARFAAVFGGYPAIDDNGHGTHVAATAAGNQLGVAKAANIIAVKVLNAQNRGNYSDIIAGLEFVFRSATSSNRSPVVNLSLGGSPSQAVDNACINLVNAGVHLSVAAGNDNIDAINISPAHVAVVNTVGASNIFDARWPNSNYGAVLDIFAPGENIVSAGIASPTSLAVMSGTSMAAPHVAGLIAYLLALNGYVTPAAMTNALHALGTDGILSGLPGGTRNELARNNIA